MRSARPVAHIQYEKCKENLCQKIKKRDYFRDTGDKEIII
jgi:hypothetical protein